MWMEERWDRWAEGRTDGLPGMSIYPHESECPKIIPTLWATVHNYACQSNMTHPYPDFCHYKCLNFGQSRSKAEVWEKVLKLEKKINKSCFLTSGKIF